MALSLKPLGNHLVVEPLEEADATASGIILPQTAKEKPQQGTVRAVGPGRMLDEGQREPMSVEVSDRVLYARYSGTTVKIEGRELLILTEDEVLAIVE